MKNLKEFIESGILELYVLGLSSEEQNLEVKEMCSIYPEVNAEIEAIETALIFNSKSKTQINPDVKSLLMGTVDYMERLKSGETPTFPPELNERSRVVDFESWLNRKDLDLSTSEEDIALKIIGYEPEKMTAIVRILHSTTYEIHDKEFEKFLIVEGTCDVVTDEKTYSLVAGDYYCVPLNLGHVIKVTSKIPCTVILQRIAA